MIIENKNLDKINYTSCTYKNCTFFDLYISNGEFFYCQFVKCIFINNVIRGTVFDSCLFIKSKIFNTGFIGYSQITNSKFIGGSLSFIHAVRDQNVFYNNLYDFTNIDTSVVDNKMRMIQ